MGLCMNKLACLLLRVGPMNTSAFGKMMTPALLVGILLSAWPVLAQSNSGDPSAPSSWKRPSREVQRQVSRPSSAEQRSPANTASPTKTRFQTTENAKAPSPDRQLTQPDEPEEEFDTTLYDDGCFGECCPAECYPNRCGPCSPCFPLFYNRLWVRGEYLLWWTQGSNLPPLVTTSPEGTDSGVAGVLGQSSTSVLFGEGMVNTNANSGWRITMGYWFDDCQGTGIEASYLGLGQKTTHFFASSQDTSIIARPFFDAQFDTQSAMLAAYPNVLEGSVSCSMSSQFQAVEVLFRRKIFQGDCDHMDFLIGWRYARLDESLRINQSSQWTQSQGPIVAGTTKELYDLFDAQNQFNGAELGIVYREHVGRWSFEALMKLGLGCTRSQVLIDGRTTTTVPGSGTSSFTGDLLAQETNIGHYSKDSFAIVPELGVTLGCDLTCQLRATFGYTFLYWSQVARPANQLDTNASQLPPETPTGSHQPAFDFNMSDYWAQGLNFGLEYRF